MEYSDREVETESKRENFHPLFTPQMASVARAWARWKPGACSGSPSLGRDPSTWTVFHYIPRNVRELIEKWNSWNSVSIGDAAATGASFTTGL